jgi:hypothetical protein
MKRRAFLSNSVLAGAGIPLGIASSASLTSCAGIGEAKTKPVTPEDVGMFSFVDNRIVDRDGNILWKPDYENNPVKNPYEQEHIHLVESIRLNKPINQGEDLAYSSMIAVMGRESAYSGKTVTWDEIMASDLRYGPAKYEMEPVPEYEEGRFPIPGCD